MVHACYDVAKNIFNGSISRKGGLDFLESKHGMNRGSAEFYVNNYRCLIAGATFRRTMNAYATRYYLEKIYADSGRDGLLNALISLDEHIKFFEKFGYSKAVQQRKIFDEFVKLINFDSLENSFPDEVNGPGTLLEGKVRSVNVNAYERNPVARTRCIEHYGCKCYVCGFDFSVAYGELGRGFIHVHHEIEISTIGSEYVVDPVNDLKPLCPNCHAMIHRRSPAYSIEEIKNVRSKVVKPT